MQNLIESVFIGMGSNLGNREAFLNQAIGAAHAQSAFMNISISSFYETKSQGAPGPDYLNAVMAFDTDWDVYAIYDWMVDVEEKAGRKRTVLNAPRTLDLDLLFYGAEIIKLSNLTVPHPRIAERNFVLIPLNEIAPNWIHPVCKKTVAEMLNALTLAQITEVKQLQIGRTGSPPARG